MRREKISTQLQEQDSKLTDAKKQVDGYMKQTLTQHVSQIKTSINCAQQCKFESWSFRDGLTLSPSCPNTCSLS